MTTRRNAILKVLGALISAPLIKAVAAPSNPALVTQFDESGRKLALRHAIAAIPGVGYAEACFQDKLRLREEQQAFLRSRIDLMRQSTRLL